MIKGLVESQDLGVFFIADFFRINNSPHFNTANSYMIIWVGTGSLILNFEKRTYIVPDHRLAFIGKHKQVEFDGFTTTDGYIIVFSTAFYIDNTRDNYLLNSPLFLSAGTDVFITLPIGNNDDFKKLCIDRIVLYQSKSKEYYHAVVHNCIETLILDGLKDINEHRLQNSGVESNDWDIVNKFRLLVIKYYKEERTVEYYAHQLYISPRRLTKAVANILGRKPKQVINEKLIEESKRLLNSSTLSISEIAFQFNFNDTANFSIFFKKYTSISPIEYRNKNIEKNTKFLPVN